MALHQVVDNGSGVKSLDRIGCDCASISEALTQVEALVERAESAAEQAAENGSSGTPANVVEAPVFTLPESVTIAGQAVSFPVSARPLLAGASIASFTVDVPALDIVTKQYTAASNAATVSFTVPGGLPAGSVLVVEISATDTAGNKSPVTSHSMSVEGFTVLAPSITIPANDAEIDKSDNLVVTASAFQTSTGATDTHVASDWQLASDAAMTQIVQQALGSTDLTQHTFANLSLEGGNYYYLRARYQGRYGGWSPYSGVSTFKMKAGYIDTPGGRKAYRHSSDKGTVLILDDAGETVHLLVADAAYRGTAKWDSVYTSSSNAVDTSLKNYASMPTTKFDGGSSVLPTTLAATITDTQLNNFFSSHRDINTSKQNTDILVNSYASRAAAANFCRSVVIDGRGCDLCNIQRLARVYCEANFLDTLDPTVGSYTDMKLSSWNVGGKDYAWSSTERASNTAWLVSNYGDLYGSFIKNAVFSVIPVQELFIEGGG